MSLVLTTRLTDTSYLITTDDFLGTLYRELALRFFWSVGFSYRKMIGRSLIAIFQIESRKHEIIIERCLLFNNLTKKKTKVALSFR